LTDQHSPDGEPQPQARTLALESHSRWPGLVWALPLAALIIVAYLGIQAIAHAGVDVVVTFNSAADAKVGDTQVIYKGLSVGHVVRLRLNPDRQHVDMTLRLDPSLKPLLRQGTKFWLVGAKPSLTDLNSLKAALAGVTIGFAPGDGEPVRHFAGLDEPPQVLPGTKGSPYELVSNQVGATREGASVFYHGLEVGKVTDVDLLGRNNFKTKIFVQAPYDRFVRRGTLFFNTSAVQISLSGGSISTQFAPGNAALSGGVEFDTPADAVDQTTAPAASSFPLFADRSHAINGPRGPQVFYRVLFTDPVGELDVGAPVTLRGFQIGSVTSRDLEFDPDRGVLTTPVTIGIEPERLVRQQGKASATAETAASTDRAIEQLLKLGFRARLAQNPPIVGSRMVELDVVPGARKVALSGDRSGADFPIIPDTSSGDVTALAVKANDILAQVQQVPFAQIGSDVRAITSKLSTLVSSPKVMDSLTHLDSSLNQIDQTLTETRPKIGPLVDNLKSAANQVDSLATAANALVSGDGSTQDASLPGTLHQLTDAARALRGLADYLSRHPEAIIRGKAKQ
jgi:paraquat-inducible protein B